MTAKEYLGQISKIDRMVVNKLYEIEELETMACNVTISTEQENVKSSGSKDRIGILATKCVDLSKEVDVLLDKKFGIIKQMENLDSEIDYEVLFKTFVCHKTVEQLSEIMQCSIDNAFKLRQKAIKNFRKKYITVLDLQ